MNNFLTLFINKINNSIRNKFNYLFFFFSKKIFNILKLLKYNGYIDNFFLLKYKLKKFLLIKIKYFKETSVIQVFKLYSKPSLKIYKGYKFLPKVMNGLGLLIISTTKGYITDYDCIKLGIGGKIICYVF